MDGAAGSVVREQAAWTGEQGARGERAAWIWSSRERRAALQLPCPTRYQLRSGWAGPRDPD